MLPSRGRCHAVFLLVYTARLKSVSSVAEWVSAARERATYMAASLDLEGTAKTLVALNLVHCETAVLATSELMQLSDHADFRTLVGIARVLILRAPPPWIRAVVSGDQVAREYIPSEDMAVVEWLGDELDAIVIEANRRLNAVDDDGVRKRLGNSAELIVCAALRRIGGQVVHVARISDIYGYDIEHRLAVRTKRLEIKAAVRRTCGVVHVSRNEFDKSRLFGEEWRLVQVVFSTRVLIPGVPVGAADVEEIRELSAAGLQALAPPPLDTFRWTDSAEFRPPLVAWTKSRIVPDPYYVIKE